MQVLLSCLRTSQTSGIESRSTTGKPAEDCTLGLSCSSGVSWRTKRKPEDVRLYSSTPCKTSQRCSRCGFTYRGNRRSQSEFLCCKCGFHLNADLQASRNIRDKYLVGWSISPSDALSSTSVSSRSLPVGKGRDKLTALAVSG